MTNFNGTFSSELANYFLLPLKDLLSLGCNKIYLDFVAEEKTININATNDSATNFIIVKYKSAFFEELENFKSDGDFSFGIYELGKLVSMFDVFQEGFNIDISEEKLRITQKSDVFDWYATDNNLIDLIRRGPKNVSEDSMNWLTSFTWSKKELKPFTNAISKIDQEFIIINGKKDDNSIMMSLTNKDIKANSFRRSIDTSIPIEENFKFITEKTLIAPIICSKNFENLKVDLQGDRVIRFLGDNEYYTMSYFVKAVI